MGHKSRNRGGRSGAKRSGFFRSSSPTDIDPTSWYAAHYAANEGAAKATDAPDANMPKAARQPTEPPRHASDYGGGRGQRPERARGAIEAPSDAAAELGRALESAADVARVPWASTDTTWPHLVSRAFSKDMLKLAEEGAEEGMLLDHALSSIFMRIKATLKAGRQDLAASMCARLEYEANSSNLAAKKIAGHYATTLRTSTAQTREFWFERCEKLALQRHTSQAVIYSLLKSLKNDNGRNKAMACLRRMCATVPNIMIGLVDHWKNQDGFNRAGYLQEIRLLARGEMKYNNANFTGRTSSRPGIEHSRPSTIKR